MTTHYFISTIRSIPEFHEPDNNHPFISGEAYKEDLPFNLPYVYEVGSDEVELILFLDEFMLLGDIVEYCFQKVPGTTKRQFFNIVHNRRTNSNKKIFHLGRFFILN